MLISLNDSGVPARGSKNRILFISFVSYLLSYTNFTLIIFPFLCQFKQCSDEEGDSSDQGEQNEDDEAKDNAKSLSNQVIVKWCQMVKEDQSQPALISLLNAYRAACHYGAESVGHRIDNSETFCNILISTLSNVDDAFRGILQFSSSNNKKDAVVKLQKTSKWKNMKPLVKSFVRSTLFLLDQVTDLEILTFAMTRIRASLVFFVAFPPLTQRLLKVSSIIFVLQRFRLLLVLFINLYCSLVLMIFAVYCIIDCYSKVEYSKYYLLDIINILDAFLYCHFHLHYIEEE